MDVKVAKKTIVKVVLRLVLQPVGKVVELIVLVVDQLVIMFV